MTIRTIFIRLRPYYWLIFFAVLLIVSALFWLRPQGPGPQTASRTAPPAARSEMSATKVDYATSRKGYTLRLTADSFNLKKQKMGILTFNPGRVLELRSLKMVIDYKAGNAGLDDDLPDNFSLDAQDENVFQEADFKEVIQGLIPVKTGLITGLNVSGFQLIIKDIGNLMSSISAEKLKNDGFSGGFVLSGNIVLASPRINIRARKMNFNPMDSTLKTIGPYQIVKSGNQHELYYETCGYLVTYIRLDTFFCARTGEEIILSNRQN